MAAPNLSHLVDELKNEDIQLRLNCVRKLSKIAAVVGPEKTQKELLPALKESLDDEDEVLVAIAEELGKFTGLVGGPKNAHVLFPLLEILACIEETIVRTKAVESLCAIAKTMPDDHFEEHFIKLIHHLATAPGFSCVRSACALIPEAYPRASSTSKVELRVLYKNLCEGDNPIIKRAAFVAMSQLVVSLDKDIIKKEILDLYRTLCRDDSDFVRLAAIENGIAISVKLTPEDVSQFVKPLLLGTAADKSWRVRQTLASKFGEVASVLSLKTASHNDWIGTFVKLLKDPEVEVKTAATQSITKVCSSLPLDVAIKTLLPLVKNLAADESEFVRAACASDVIRLTTKFGKEGTFEYLMDIILLFFRDDSHDVRLSVVTSLDKVVSRLGAEQLLSHLIPVLIEVSEDRHWRIRLGVLKNVPLLAEQLGTDFYTSQLSDLSILWLSDCVQAIRKNAVQNIAKLTAKPGGQQWFHQVFPKILELSKNTNYLLRVMPLQTISEVAQDVSPKTIVDDFIPLLLVMAEDKVPNIRLNVAKTLARLILAATPDQGETKLKPILVKLSQDSDMDVRYFAVVAQREIDRDAVNKES